MAGASSVDVASPEAARQIVLDTDSGLVATGSPVAEAV